MIIPFGKFKGQEVENLPISYVKWLLENVILDDKLQKELQNQIKFRSDEGVVRDRMYIDKHRMGNE